MGNCELKFVQKDLLVESATRTQIFIVLQK